MMEDPIIAEVHQFREEWAAQFNYDFHAIVADLRRSQQEANRQVVNLSSKPVAEVTALSIDESEAARLAAVIEQMKAEGVFAAVPAVLPPASADFQPNSSARPAAVRDHH